MRDARLDPAAATGLALTLALVLAIGGGLVLGVLAYLVRSNGHLIGIDNGVAKWGNRHASATSTHVLNGDHPARRHLHDHRTLRRARGRRDDQGAEPLGRSRSSSRSSAATRSSRSTVKQLADRVRPSFNPAAATLGPSFPSGHSATAAAFYATAALLIGRWRGRQARALLAGLAVGIAVAVAASRVLLDVHWVSDVIAGLALGWAWFSVCAIAFGGRILRFGAAAETAARAADRTGATAGDELRQPAVSARAK